MGPERAIRLRPTRVADLPFVQGLERDPENTPFIGSWTHAEHVAAMERADREHWIVERAGPGTPMGYLIAYDSTEDGGGVYLKRIVIAEKGCGVGSAALELFLQHALVELRAGFVWLVVVPENERAQKVYRSLGFETRRERLANGNVVMVLGEAPEPPSPIADSRHY